MGGEGGEGKKVSKQPACRDKAAMLTCWVAVERTPKTAPQRRRFLLPNHNYRYVDIFG